MLLLAVFAFVLSALVSLLVLRWARRRRFSYDPAAPQRFHVGETPRLGGVGMLVSVWGGWLLGLVLSRHFGDPTRLGMGVWVASWAVALLPAVLGGVWEDLTQRLSVLYRLGLTLITGVLAVTWCGLAVPRLGVGVVDGWMHAMPWLGVVLALIAITGLPHAFNIIDGYNGLAAMVAIVVCLALAHVALQVNDRALASILAVTAASTTGFLIWNYPRGWLFAGDGGAYLWGVVIAFASIALVQRHAEVSAWFPMLLLIYPVWETVFSIYRKLVRGDSPGMADALHFHQLVYRRIVRGVFDGDDEARDMLIRNNRTSPYLWGFTMLTVVPAVLFWRNTPVLMAFCALFCATYLAAYIAIVRFKVPGWMRF
ncbi:glycosyltransferase [Oryzisolibacter sp. LB2S]|uniref:glycosyltransferase family 4 protein n=1 Tax=Alicycliphilus soli TaxID=3228789 RepID=UPI0034595D8F